MKSWILRIYLISHRLSFVRSDEHKPILFRFHGLPEAENKNDQFMPIPEPPDCPSAKFTNTLQLFRLYANASRRLQPPFSSQTKQRQKRQKRYLTEHRWSKTQRCIIELHAHFCPFCPYFILYYPVYTSWYITVVDHTSSTNRGFPGSMLLLLCM